MTRCFVCGQVLRGVSESRDAVVLCVPGCLEALAGNLMLMRQELHETRFAKGVDEHVVLRPRRAGREFWRKLLRVRGVWVLPGTPRRSARDRRTR